MKRLKLKKTISMLIVLAFVVSIIPLTMAPVLAATGDVGVKYEFEDVGSGIYKLVFKAKVPDKICLMAVIFSYDMNIIQPVAEWDTSYDVDVDYLSNPANMDDAAPFGAPLLMAPPPGAVGVRQFSFLPIMWKEIGTRAGFYATVMHLNRTADSNGEYVDVFEFYFRFQTSKSVDDIASDTFKFESGAEPGGFVLALFPIGTTPGILLAGEDESEQYIWGHPDQKANPDSIDEVINPFAVVVTPDPLTGTATISNTSPRIGDVLTGSLAGGNNTGTLNYQWKADGANVGTGASYTVATADFGKAITLEITSSVESGTLTSAATDAVLKKVGPAAPAAPTLDNATATTITITAIPGMEYRIQGEGSWQSSNYYENLKPNQNYIVYQRIAETADTEASAESDYSFLSTTRAILSGSVAINGTAKFGQTLTVDMTALTSTPTVTFGTFSYQWERGGSSITGATGATYILVEDDIGQVITVTVTVSNCIGGVTSGATATVDKADGPAAPAAPTLDSKTQTTVTLTANALYEYRLGTGGTWQASNVFSGLTASTTYSFYQRVAETADTYTSAASAVLSVTTDAAGPGALTGTATISNTSPRIGDVLTGSLAGGNNTGTLSYQWKADGTNVGTGASYTVATADFGKAITLEITSSVETGTVTSTATAAVLKKVGPAAPAAPTLDAATATTITITAIPGMEYRIQGEGSWQSSNYYENLKPNQSYIAYQRIAETDDTEASAESDYSFLSTTRAILGGSVAINGTAKYGQTLTVDMTDLTSTPTVTFEYLSYQWERGGSSITGATGATYIIVEDDIGQVITVTVTVSNCIGSVTSGATATVDKADGPAAPAIDYIVTDDPADVTNPPGEENKIITIVPVAGAEYSFDGSVYGSVNVIEGVAYNAIVNIAIRFAETNTHYASAEATAVVYLTNAEQPAPAVFTLTFVLNPDGVTYTAIIFEVPDGEYSFDGVTFGPGNTKDDCVANTSYTGYVRLASQPGYNASPVTSDTQVTPMHTIATPNISPVGGSFTGSQTVTITSATAGAAIYYTTDGSVPTDQSMLYTAPFTITATTTVRAISIMSGMIDSAESTAAYTLIVVAPAITGPTSMTLTAGYAAVSTDAYAVTGEPAPIVAKTSGDAAISWNDATQTIEIAAGLAAGSYPVVLTASNGVAPDAEITFTLTVQASGASGGGGGGSPGPGNVTGTPPVTEEKETEIVEEDVPLASAAAKHDPYINGYEDGTVRPDRPITRAEVATIIWRLLPASDQHGSSTGNFSDVADGAWYSEAVNRLADLGVLLGYDDGTFRPNTNITREEFTAIVCRYFDAESESDANPFNDLTVNWAYEYIIKAAGLGWIVGYEGAFRQKDAITRAEVMTIINRILDRRVLTQNIPAEFYTIFSDLTISHWAFQDILEASTTHLYTIGEAGTEIWEVSDNK